MSDEAPRPQPHEELSLCRSCHAPIVWLTMPSGKKNPANADTVEPGDEFFVWGKHVSHFATCEQAAEWRKSKR